VTPTPHRLLVPRSKIE